jgi:beta-1,4-N-acetylglucosaminyltransferase
MASTTALIWLVTLAVITIPLIAFRIFLVIDPDRTKPTHNLRRTHDEPAHLLIVLGSGGHTAEMIAILTRAVKEPNEDKRLSWNDFRHRTWVVGAEDTISAQRAQEFEDMAFQLSAQGKSDGSSQPPKANIQTVPRARAIHQSLLTAPISSLRCLRACLLVLTNSSNDFPDIILCNGPATATILVFASILLRFFNFGSSHSKGKMRTIYVESWARVKQLSLSGILLERVVDRFLVQWPQLVDKKAPGRKEYIGVLV